MTLIYYHSTGIIKVFSSCHNLQTVYLRRCVNVTDDAVAALTQHCSHLEHLNLCGCINITDASLQLIALNCGFLQSLNISKTKVSKKYPFVHLLLYCWICIFEYLQDKMYYVPDYASLEGEVNPFVLFCTCLLDYEQSFFFLVHWAKHMRHANDHNVWLKVWDRRGTREVQEREWLPPLFLASYSFAAWSTCISVLPSLNLKEKRLLAVCLPSCRSALFRQEKTFIWLSNNSAVGLSFFGKDVQVLANVQPPCWPRKLGM